MGSAGRLQGVAVGDVARLVQDSFTGPTTCTHLNDTFRTMGDLATLLGVWQEQASHAA